MRNLVKRLRTELFGGTFDTMREAADRIEALEAALEKLATDSDVELTQLTHAVADNIRNIVALEAALRSSDAELRLLVDLVWQHATESTAVPFHKTSDMLIAKYRAALTPEQDK